MRALTNQLIESLPSKDRKRLLAICEPVELVLSEVLFDSDTPTRHVYFPTGGFVSLVTPLEGKPVLEVGIVGREGMLGSQVALGVTTIPLHALVQGPGPAWRITTAAFKYELGRSVAMQRNLNRYIHVSMLQLAAMAGCVRFHQIGPRLARWLLMMHDRSPTDTFHVTHEFLAYMLGVRRVGITGAAVSFQRRGLIDYRRGELTVLDRAALEASACSCYATDQKSYAEFLN